MGLRNAITTGAKHRRRQRGFTLTELSVSMGIGALLSTAFFSVFIQLSKDIQQETIVGQYQDTVNLALDQVAKDFRLAGSNPSGNFYLFDSNPATDVAVDIDPDHDGDTTNAILVRADKRGLEDGEGDGDADDTLETVMLHYDPETARLWRHTWRVPPAQSGLEDPHTPGYDTTPFLEGICSFELQYLDSYDRPTTNPDFVASIIIELTSASGPRECFQSNSFTRTYNATIRIRNR